MPSHWNALLSTLPPSFPHQATALANPEKDGKDTPAIAISCLTETEYLKVTGPDRFTFLQGQTTCDFREIEQNLSRLGAHCNTKGRICASFRAIDYQDATYLLLPTGQASYLKSLLDMYIVFSNADMFVDEQSLYLIGLSGIHCETLINKHFGSTPQRDETVTQKGIVTRIAETPLFVALLDLHDATALFEIATNAKASVTGQSFWSLQALLQGIGHVLPECKEQFIPQTLNYDLINGVSFDKGCYKGQEIIARLHYKGTSKHRTYLYSIATDQAPSAGTAIYQSDSTQACGHVVQSIPCDGHKTYLLAAIKTSAANSTALHYPMKNNEKDTLNLHVVSLPYAITK